MITALRILAAMAAMLLAMPGLMVLRAQLRNGFDAMGLIFAAAPAIGAVLLAWFAVRGSVPGARSAMASALVGGCVVGGLGFSAGFFGPILFAPDANQGPLLGIFITGPLGFVAGVVLGLVVHAARCRSDATPDARQ